MRDARPVGADVLERLRAFSRLEDPDAGTSEEQRFVETDDGRLFTTLVRPLGAQREVGFVICHSFGFEQFELFPLELLFARRAAAAGFPTLYVQARGYGDSGGDLAEASPQTHVRDVLAAQEDLVARTSVRGVVPVGARFGASVALRSAGELGAPGVALWQPSLDPGAYLDGLLRAFARSQVVGARDDRDAARPSTRELQAALSAGEQVDLLGFPLSPGFYAAAKATRPLDEIARPPQRALLLGVNPLVDREIARGVSRLEELGVSVRAERAEGPGHGTFGLGLPVSGHLATNLELFEDVARRTVAWAEEVW
jgi:pimeloyl-ACP methyl ester carboxylesterase